jgi:hypothetical protein
MSGQGPRVSGERGSGAFYAEEASSRHLPSLLFVALCATHAGKQAPAPDDQRQRRHHPGWRLLSRKGGSAPVAVVAFDYLTPLSRIGANK